MENTTSSNVRKAMEAVDEIKAGGEQPEPRWLRIWSHDLREYLLGNSCVLVGWVTCSRCHGSGTALPEGVPKWQFWRWLSMPVCESCAGRGSNPYLVTDPKETTVL